MEPVPLVEVESSNVRAISHDAEIRRSCALKMSGVYQHEFYQYENVSESVCYSSLVAPANGQLVWQEPRSHDFETRIG